MYQIKINPRILRWARERLELPSDVTAKKTGTKPEKIVTWEQGRGQPTFRRLRLLAKALYVPMGYFFLQHPPEIVPAIPDFRTLPNHLQGKYSVDLQEVLDDTLRKRDWYREWRLAEGGKPLTFIGKFKIGDQIAQIVEDIKKALAIGNFPGEGRKSWYEALGHLINRAENAV